MFTVTVPHAPSAPAPSIFESPLMLAFNAIYKCGMLVGALVFILLWRLCTPQESLRQNLKALLGATVSWWMYLPMVVVWSFAWVRFLWQRARRA